MSSKVKNKITAIVAETICKEVSKINSHDNLAIMHGIDSFDYIKIVVEIEDAYDIELPHGMFGKAPTIHDLAIFTEKERRGKK